MPRRKFQWTEELLQLASEGKAVATVGGRVVPYQLSEDDRAAFETAKGVGYVVLPHGKDALSNCFAAWRRLRRLPLVYVQPGGSTALVFCAMDACGYGLHAAALVEVERLDRWGRTRFKTAPTDWAALTGIPVKSAPWVAERLYKIAVGCDPSKPKSKRRTSAR